MGTQAFDIRKTFRFFEQIEPGLPLLENIHHAQTAWYGLVFLKNLFYPVEAFTHLAYPFLRPYAVDYAKGFYESNRGRMTPFVFGYDQFSHLLPAPFGGLSKAEIKNLPDESIGDWIKKQKGNTQTLAKFFEEHPFAKQIFESAGAALPPNSEQSLTVKDLFDTFQQDTKIKTVLEYLEKSTFRPAPIAQRLAKWKITLTDPENTEWLVAKVVAQALLILPLAYCVHKTLELCVGRSYSFSYVSLFFSALISSATTVLTEYVAAIFLKRVASQEPPK